MSIFQEINIYVGFKKNKRGINNEHFTAIKPGFETSLEDSITLRPKSNFEIDLNTDWIRQTMEKGRTIVFEGLTYSASFLNFILKKV